MLLRESEYHDGYIHGFNDERDSYQMSFFLREHDWSPKNLLERTEKQIEDVLIRHFDRQLKETYEKFIECLRNVRIQTKRLNKYEDHHKVEKESK